MSSGAQAGCLVYAEELCHLDERSSRQRIWSRGPHWPRDMMYLIPGPVCGERTLATAQKLSERPNRAGIISICPLHNIVGV